MAQVGATEFKARCLELMDRVAERRETYVITKRGKPVAKLVPADPPRNRKSSFGCLAGQFDAVGDIVSSLHSDEEWREMQRRRDERWRAGEKESRATGKGSAGHRPSRSRQRS